MADFTLPELGENIAAGDVLRVLVQPGDTLTKDQPVLELETDKATIEVPSSVAGKIKEIKVKAGDKVKVGQAILSVDDGAATSAPPPAAPPPAKPAPAEAAAPKEESAPSEVARPFQPSTGSGWSERAEGQSREQDREKVVDFARGARTPVGQPVSDEPAAPAAPSVRRMARELGVDINDVIGSGEDGRISIDDVKAHAKRLIAAAAVPAAQG